MFNLFMRLILVKLVKKFGNFSFANNCAPVNWNPLRGACIYVPIFEIIKQLNSIETLPLAKFLAKKKHSDDSGKRMQTIMSYTMNNFESEISLDAIAEKANMTKNLLMTWTFISDLDEMGYKQFISVLTATVRQQTQTSGPNNLELAAATDLSASQSTMALLTLLKDTLASSSVMEEQVLVTNSIVISLPCSG